MAATKKPYEQFGPYLLFKKLESDALGELWRAGRIDGNAMGPVVALRRITGGNRDAFVAAAAAASGIAPLLSGTSFVKHQVIDTINGTPFVAHEYAGGRSVRHIVDRARGGNGVTPNPLPLDQAIVIAERVALSLATTSDMKYSGNRLLHGALIPQFVWVSDDGEIRVAGQQLGKAFAASLKDSRFAAEFGRYAAPELHASGEPSKSSEVFALGALLYLLTTGAEPPDASSSSAFANALLAAKTATGEPLPDDIRAILNKSLTVDPSTRYSSAADFKQAISALAHGGKYSATTFNLAFYLSSLLKKEMEGEAIDRDRESKVNVGVYLEAPSQPAVAPVIAPVIEAAPMFGAVQPEAKSKLPLAIAAGVALAVLGGGAFMMMGKKNATPVTTSQPALASSIAVPTPAAAPKIVSQPIVASPTASAAPDPDAQKKAFEEAVAQKMQEEMMKLQSEYNKKLQQQQSRNAPVLTQAPAPQQQPQQRAAQNDDGAPSAASLDAQRRPAPTPAPAAAAPQLPPQTAAAPTPVAPTPAPQQSAPAPAPQVASVRDGDVVDVSQLDSAPQPLSPIRPVYPPMARSQRFEGTVMVTALISESGSVLDVRILRAAGKLGLDDAAIRAIRATRFSTPQKDGHRVKTWMPYLVQFKL